MSQITHNDSTYNILDEVYAKFPELISLILGSESINESDQKQYWFDMLPSMTDHQVDRLFNILMTEKQEIERLDLAFQEDIKKLNEKHLIEWQQLQSQRAKEKIAEQEKNDNAKSEAEDALGEFGIL